VELQRKALYFVQPRGENFGIVNKSTVFGSAAQRKVVELRTKALHFVQPRTEKIMNCEQKHFFVQPRSEFFWNRDQKHGIWVSCAANFFGIATKSTAFCSAAQRIFLNCEQKHSTAQRNFWNLLHFVLPRSQNFRN
jgi:hypothetical protein